MTGVEPCEIGTPVLTVPEIWVKDHVAGPAPHKKVVAVITPQGEELRLPEYQDSGSEESLPINEPVSGRLAEFFRTYTPGAKRSRGYSGRYNCKVFGSMMITGVRDSDNTIERKAMYVVEHGQPTESNLKMGQLGVLGYKRGRKTIASHAVIGLGEDVDKCIQVMWTNGHIGITSYEDLIEFYVRRSFEWSRGEAVAQMFGEQRRDGLLRKVLGVSSPTLFVGPTATK